MCVCVCVAVVCVWVLSIASGNIIAKGVHLVAAMYTKRAAQHGMFTRTNFMDLLRLHQNKMS